MLLGLVVGVVGKVPVKLPVKLMMLYVPATMFEPPRLTVGVPVRTTLWALMVSISEVLRKSKLRVEEPSTVRAPPTVRAPVVPAPPTLSVLPVTDSPPPRVVLAPEARVPAVTLVVPVARSLPPSVRTPDPLLVTLPVEAGTLPAIVRLPDELETLMAATVAGLMVKPRLVLDAPVPVYCSVPPAKTRLEAAAGAAPSGPATPPLETEPTLRMPVVNVVGPV